MAEVSRNSARHHWGMKPNTFTLQLGPGVELLAEHHEGDTSTLTLQRSPTTQEEPYGLV